MLNDFRLALLSPAHEASLAAEQFARRKMLVIVLMVLAAGFSVVQLPTTRAVLGATNAALGIWSIRGLVIAATLLLAVRASRSEAPRHLGRITAAWTVCFVAGVVIENSLLPPHHTAFAVWDVFFVLTIYAAVPFSIGRKAGLAAILSFTDILLLWRSVEPGNPSQAANITLAYVCANVVGAFVAWEMERWRRRQFLTRESERDARRQLEAALAEIRTLRGIIPICSFCKDVRTDCDGWHEIEDYVRSHSAADFSHGVCPDCMKEHYPRVAARD